MAETSSNRLRAWSRSCAVVSSRVATEGLGDGGAGALEVVDDTDSAAQWVAALRRLENTDAVQKMRARGLSLVKRHHAPEAIAEQLLELYERIASGDDATRFEDRGAALEGYRPRAISRIGDAAFGAER